MLCNTPLSDHPSLWALQLWSIIWVWLQMPWERILNFYCSVNIWITGEVGGERGPTLISSMKLSFADMAWHQNTRSPKGGGKTKEVRVEYKEKSPPCSFAERCLCSSTFYHSQTGSRSLLPYALVCSRIWRIWLSHKSISTDSLSITAKLSLQDIEV